METRCYGIGEDSRLRPVELEDALEAFERGEGTFWIDVEGPAPEAKAGLLTKLGIDEETIGNIAEHGHAARVLPIEDGLFFEYPIELSGEPPELNSVGFVLRDRVVITLRYRALSLAGWSGVSGKMQLAIQDDSPAGLVCALLLASSVKLREVASDLRMRTLKLSRVMDADGASVSTAEVTELKQRIIDLDAVCDERIAVMQRLESMEQLFSRAGLHHDQFRTTLANLEHTGRRTDRLDRRADDLQARLDSREQDKMNRRLSRLTIISAIFLPLTLIAGIYGMNFTVMPELQIPWAYPVALGAMLLIAVGMVVWFKVKGWME